MRPAATRTTEAEADTPFDEGCFKDEHQAPDAWDTFDVDRSWQAPSCERTRSRVLWLASHKAGLQSGGPIDGTRSTLRRQHFDVLCRSELFEEARPCT